MPSARPRFYRAASTGALMALLCLGQNAVAQPAPSAVLDSLAALAAAEGSVRVIVGLNLTSHPEGLLNARDVLQQRANIRAAQNALVSPDADGHFVATPIRFSRPSPSWRPRSTPARLGRLRASPFVRSIEEDHLAATSLLQSAPLINAPTAWTKGSSGSGWAVAVLDTGVDNSHPFLAGKVVSEACYSTTSALNDRNRSAQVAHRRALSRDRPFLALFTATTARTWRASPRAAPGQPTDHMAWQRMPA